MVSRRTLTRYVARELTDGKKPTDVTDQLAAYIVTHRLHGSVGEIIGDIRLELNRLGHTSANVTTARPLDAKLRADVEKQVRRMEDAKTVEVIEHVDPRIIGGIIIETPTKRFDASLTTKLKRLKQTV